MTLVTLFTIVMTAKAMSYEQARREALFLTDKMAYELNLNDEQYNAAYEINMDYLMDITTPDELYGRYWTRRNADMSYILFDWQWSLFQAATYFYRPLYWNAGYWHFAVYARYPRRDFFYFSFPSVHITYCGGHSWRNNRGHSYYYKHRDHYRPKNHQHIGMKDRWEHHNSGTQNHGNHSYGNSNSGFGGNRNHGNNGGGSNEKNHGNNSSFGSQRPDRNGNGSSTRVTANRPENLGQGTLSQKSLRLEDLKNVNNSGRQNISSKEILLSNSRPTVNNGSSRPIVDNKSSRPSVTNRPSSSNRTSVSNRPSVASRSASRPSTVSSSRSGSIKSSGISTIKGSIKNNNASNGVKGGGRR